MIDLLLKIIKTAFVINAIAILIAMGVMCYYNPKYVPNWLIGWIFGGIIIPVCIGFVYLSVEVIKKIWEK